MTLNGMLTLAYCTWILAILATIWLGKYISRLPLLKCSLVCSFLKLDRNIMFQSTAHSQYYTCYTYSNIHSPYKITKNVWQQILGYLLMEMIFDWIKMKLKVHSFIISVITGYIWPCVVWVTLQSELFLNQQQGFSRPHLTVRSLDAFLPQSLLVFTDKPDSPCALCLLVIWGTCPSCTMSQRHHWLPWCLQSEHCNWWVYH